MSGRGTQDARATHMPAVLEYFGLLFIVPLACLAPVAAAAEDSVLTELFARRGVEGTMVISSLRSGRSYVHNDARANRRFPPASTFKILNTLIALEESAISGKDEVLTWDGHIHTLPDWNRDQTLGSAFKFSCVWCYHELARRVGAEKYRSYLGSTAYGELHEPFEEETFWLDGSLEISAIEQVRFLKNVVEHSYSFGSASYETLREIMVVEQTHVYTLRAKTGWATRATPQVGWYVGYVETPADVWFFALNMVIRGEEDLPMRQQLTREAFQATGILN